MQTEIALAVVCAVAVGRFRIAQLGRLPRNRSGGPIFRTKCFRINRYLGEPSFHTRNRSPSSEMICSRHLELADSVGEIVRSTIALAESKGERNCTSRGG